MLLQWYWLLTGPVTVEQVACKHSMLWRPLMSNVGGAYSEASWHAQKCVTHVALSQNVYLYSETILH